MAQIGGKRSAGEILTRFPQFEAEFRAANCPDLSPAALAVTKLVASTTRRKSWLAHVETRGSATGNEIGGPPLIFCDLSYGRPVGGVPTSVYQLERKIQKCQKKMEKDAKDRFMRFKGGPIWKRLRGNRRGHCHESTDKAGLRVRADFDYSRSANYRA